MTVVVVKAFNIHIQERKEIFYLTTHTEHILFTVIWHRTHGKGPRKERKGNILFNDTLNTFYLQLYGIGHMVKHQGRKGKEIFYLTTYTQHILFTVIWRQTYGKGLFR